MIHIWLASGYGSIGGIYPGKNGTESDQTEVAATLLARAREIVPILAERAAQAERNRSIPAATIADFKLAGFFRVIQPKRYSGYELDPANFSTSR